MSQEKDLTVVHRPFLQSLTITNLLSFGPDSTAIPLQPLNIIVGTNGSGKSNFLEAITLLQAAPKDLSKPVRDAGGIEEWLWKPGGRGITASLEAIIGNVPEQTMPLRHHISFRESGQRFEIVEERIETKEPFSGHSQPHVHYRLEQGRAWIHLPEKEAERELRRETLHPEQSILSQRKDIDSYPEITRLGEAYHTIKLYREWSIGRFTAPRLYQHATGRNTILEEDFTNLGLVLNRLRRDVTAKSALLEHLAALNSDIKDFDVDIENGKVQLFFQEKDVVIPATRLSDGTLRFIALLAILCHPNPPPLVCIEEPELALHPDIIPTLADLLKTASQRMQLMVTTHSDILVDEFTDTPENVIVCDKDNMQTRMRRLEKQEQHLLATPDENASFHGCVCRTPQQKNPQSQKNPAFHQPRSNDNQRI